MVLPPGRLDGWKTIADYLDRDERTVQRWRKERGMPVHRVPGVKGGTVFAYPEELERWLVEQTRVHPDPARAASAPEPAQIPQSVPNAGWRRWTGSRRVRLALGGSVVATVLALAAVGNWPKPVMPDRVELRGSRLAAFAEGQVLWEYDVTVVERATSPVPRVPTGASGVLADLTGDGEPEVLALVAYAPPGAGSTQSFFCLAADGRLLWSYTPELDLTFGGTRYGGPWKVPHWTTAPAGKALALWIAVNHHTWWPSALVRLDSSGQPQIRFVHPGHIYFIAHHQLERGSFIIGTGINNEHSGAMLFILKESDPPAVGPHDPGSKYACERCPIGTPLRYFVFPKSELGLLLHGSYNHGYNIVISAGGDLEVSVHEVTDPHLRAIYRIDSNFELESVAMPDLYWETHRRLEREGRIQHSVDKCPERHSKDVLDWSPGAGWKKVVISDPARRR